MSNLNTILDKHYDKKIDFNYFWISWEIVELLNNEIALEKYVMNNLWNLLDKITTILINWFVLKNYWKWSVLFMWWNVINQDVLYLVIETTINNSIALTKWQPIVLFWSEKIHKFIFEDKLYFRVIFSDGTIMLFTENKFIEFVNQNRINVMYDKKAIFSYIRNLVIRLKLYWFDTKHILNSYFFYQENYFFVPISESEILEWDIFKYIDNLEQNINNEFELSEKELIQSFVDYLSMVCLSDDTKWKIEDSNNQIHFDDEWNTKIISANPNLFIDNNVSKLKSIVAEMIDKYEEITYDEFLNYLSEADSSLKIIDGFENVEYEDFVIILLPILFEIDKNEPIILQDNSEIYSFFYKQKTYYYLLNYEKELYLLLDSEKVSQLWYIAPNDNKESIYQQVLIEKSELIKNDITLIISIYWDLNHEMLVNKLKEIDFVNDYNINLEDFNIDEFVNYIIIYYFWLTNEPNIISENVDIWVLEHSKSSFYCISDWASYTFYSEESFEKIRIELWIQIDKLNSSIFDNKEILQSIVEKSFDEFGEYFFSKIDSIWNIWIDLIWKEIDFSWYFWYTLTVEQNFKFIYLLLKNLIKITTWQFVNLFDYSKIYLIQLYWKQIYYVNNWKWVFIMNKQRFESYNKKTNLIITYDYYVTYYYLQKIIWNILSKWVSEYDVLNTIKTIQAIHFFDSSYINIIDANDLAEFFKDIKALFNTEIDCLFKNYIEQILKILDDKYWTIH